MAVSPQDDVCAKYWQTDLSLKKHFIASRMAMICVVVSSVSFKNSNDIFNQDFNVVVIVQFTMLLLKKFRESGETNVRMLRVT